jgi:hypothetical protein
VSEIRTYTLVDQDNHDLDTEYDTLDEAIRAAEPGQAVVAQVYEWTDSELVWTPDGGNVWPPQPGADEEGESDDRDT